MFSYKILHRIGLKTDIITEVDGPNHVLISSIPSGEHAKLCNSSEPRRNTSKKLDT